MRTRVDVIFLWYFTNLFASFLRDLSNPRNNGILFFILHEINFLNCEAFI